MEAFDKRMHGAPRQYDGATYEVTLVLAIHQTIRLPSTEVNEETLRTIALGRVTGALSRVNLDIEEVVEMSYTKV